MNLGLGSPRCPRFLSLIHPNSVPPALFVLGLFTRKWGVDVHFCAVQCDGCGIPFLQKHVKGPKWLHFFIGLPPLLLFSGANAAFGAYAVPKLSQLTVTSYYAASSASHHAISQITRYVEGANSSSPSS